MLIVIGFFYLFKYHNETMQVGGGVKPDVLFGLQGDGPIT